MYDSEKDKDKDKDKDKEDKALLSMAIKSENSTKSPSMNWLPDKKFQLFCMLFFFFVGFYGIFMVSWTWLLYFIFSLFFSPKVIQSVRFF